MGKNKNRPASLREGEKQSAAATDADMNGQEEHNQTPAKESEHAGRRDEGPDAIDCADQEEQAEDNSGEDPESDATEDNSPEDSRQSLSPRQVSRPSPTRQQILLAIERVRVMQHMGVMGRDDAKFQLAALQAQARLIPDDDRTTGNRLSLTPDLRQVIASNPTAWNDLFPFISNDEMEAFMEQLTREPTENEHPDFWQAPPPKPGASQAPASEEESPFDREHPEETNVI